MHAHVSQANTYLLLKQGEETDLCLNDDEVK